MTPTTFWKTVLEGKSVRLFGEDRLPKPGVKGTASYKGQKKQKIPHHRIEGTYEVIEFWRGASKKGKVTYGKDSDLFTWVKGNWGQLTSDFKGEWRQTPGKPTKGATEEFIRFVKSEWVKQLEDMRDTPRLFLQGAAGEAKMTPLQKVTTVKDLADAVVFFASDASRAITGPNLTVDGGLNFN